MLVNLYDSFQFSKDNSHPLCKLFTSLPRVKLIHLDRRFNDQADKLAKEGRERLIVIEGWKDIDED